MVLYERKSRDIDKGLVGHWKLNDKRVSTSTAIDYAKFNDGTITGATNATGVNGLNPDAILFDVNDYIECSDSDLLSPSNTGNFTVSFWMSPDTLTYTDDTGSLPEGPYINFLGKGEPTKHEWTFRIHDNTGTKANMISFYIFELDGSPGRSADISESVSIDEWIHIVGTFDSSTIKIYKNGLFKDSTVWDGTAGNGIAPFRINSRNFDSFSFFSFFYFILTQLSGEHFHLLPAISIVSGGGISFPIN